MRLSKLESLDYGPYEDLYRSLHSNPGLSRQERFASETTETQLRALNSTLSSSLQISIHTSIGGYGLAATLANGNGPTILLRADMDALPVLEKTGLEYASTKTEIDSTDGKEKSTMHACGHDMHVTTLLAAAEVLAHSTDLWAGTLVLVFQPAEEKGTGARAMVQEGRLYEKVPVPDVVLGQHVFPFRAGRVEVKKGTMMSAADSWKITLHGRGGHGSMPHKCIDPVVLASNVVIRLQAIVSREVDPAESAVVTVGSLVVGEAENVIPETAVLKINVRSQSVSGRERILGAVKRIVKGECQASGCVREPEFEDITRFPLTINDDAVTDKVADAFQEHFGQDFMTAPSANNASEDVSILATSVGRPSCFWFFGGIDHSLWDKAEKEGRLHDDIPVNHSSYFAPVIQPTLKTGVATLCTAAMAYLGVKEAAPA